MKKIIAIVMALVMMMAVTVPVFAADITKDTAQAGQATVATTTDETDATYTVSYPAAFTFAWDDTNAQDANYTVTSQLPIGAKLKVSVVADNNGEMVCANAPGYALEYTLATNVSIIVAGAPIITAILAHFFIKSEKFSKYTVFGFIIAFICIIVWTGAFILVDLGDEKETKTK